MDIRFIDKRNVTPSYPSYSTGYDNFEYFSKFIDGGNTRENFMFLETCSLILVHIIRQLSDSLLLPFYMTEYSKALTEAFESISDFADNTAIQIGKSFVTCFGK